MISEKESDLAGAIINIDEENSQFSVAREGYYMTRIAGYGFLFVAWRYLGSK